MPLGATGWTLYVDCMSVWSASCIALAALLCSSAVATEAMAASPPESAQSNEDPAPITRRRRDRVRSLELSAIGMTQMLPRPAFGGDLAFTFGFPNFQARVGALLLGVPSFRLGEGEVGNSLQAATLDLCAAKPVLRHQIRMCVGGQGGGMAHFWKGYERPGRPMTAWGAATMKGDYQLKLTDHFGVIGAVGVVIPVLGPSFAGHDSQGSPTPMVFPGPMAGFLSLGTTYRW